MQRHLRHGANLETPRYLLGGEDRQNPRYLRAGGDQETLRHLRRGGNRDTPRYLRDGADQETPRLIAGSLISRPGWVLTRLWRVLATYSPPTTRRLWDRRTRGAESPAGVLGARGSTVGARRPEGHAGREIRLPGINPPGFPGLAAQPRSAGAPNRCIDGAARRERRRTEVHAEREMNTPTA